jgi:predicted O-linked N-acetylglucosamine transferase (SPINDLY family)
MMTLDQKVLAGLEHHRAGRLELANQFYSSVLADNPNHPDALRLQARIYTAVGDNQRAAINLQRAVAISPLVSDYHCDLAIVFRRLGKFDASIAQSQEALQLQPADFEAMNNLGNCLSDQHKLTEAASVYRQALSIRPNSPECFQNLGNVLRKLGNYDQAIGALKHACSLLPSDVSMQSDLGLAQLDSNNLFAALETFQHVAAVEPAYPAIFENLAEVLTRLERLDDALHACEQAIKVNPNSAEAHARQGSVLAAMGQTDQAIAAFEHALSIDSSLSHVHNNLGNAFKDQGKISQAIAAFKTAVSLNPAASSSWSNLLFTMQFDSGSNIADEAAVQADWRRQLILPIQNSCPHYGAEKGWVHRNDPRQDRQLKIGYVSADFKNHSVGRFMAPVLAQHHRDQFQVHLFSNVTRPDDATRWFRNSADRWHEIQSRSDSEVAELIMRESIDILVDLSLHTEGNRLLLFARKPAPVQVAHLAYCGTSALHSMDYTMADPHLAPPQIEPPFTEKTARLPNSYWCYSPPQTAPAVNTLPALSNGYVTFGCLNNFAKISQAAVQALIDLLGQVPNSRLVLHAKQGSHRQRLWDHLQARAFESNRLSFVDFLSFENYLSQYLKIDIGLDSFPVAGGTTTFDALWMGVPVITLAGNSPIARAGVSILNNIQMPQLVAHSVQEYKNLAVELAGDLPRLANYRATLRQRMTGSPAMSQKQYVTDLEEAYRQMWQNWCEANV